MLSAVLELMRRYQSLVIEASSRRTGLARVLEIREELKQIRKLKTVIIWIVRMRLFLFYKKPYGIC